MLFVTPVSERGAREPYLEGQERRIVIHAWPDPGADTSCRSPLSLDRGRATPLRLVSLADVHRGEAARSGGTR